MFSHLSISHSVHGGCAWQGNMCGRGCAWQGMCVAGAVNGRACAWRRHAWWGHVWQGVCGWGACMAVACAWWIMHGGGPAWQEKQPSYWNAFLFGIILPKTAWKWRKNGPSMNSWHYKFRNMEYLVEWSHK